MATPLPTMDDAARRMAAQEAALGVLAERAVEVAGGRQADQQVITDRLTRATRQATGRRLSPQRRGLNEVLQAAADASGQQLATQSEMAAILGTVPLPLPGTVSLPALPPDCLPLWRDIWLPGSGTAGVLASLTNPALTGPVQIVTAVGPFPSLAAILASLGPPPPGRTWVWSPADPNASSTVPLCSHAAGVGRVGYFNAIATPILPPGVPPPPLPPILPPILPPLPPVKPPPLPPPLPPGVCPPPVVVVPPCPPPVINLKCPDCNCPVPITCPIELTIDQKLLNTIWGQISLSAFAVVTLDQATVNNIFGALGLLPPQIGSIATVVVPISISPGSVPNPTLLSPLQIQVPCGPGLPPPPPPGGTVDDMPLTLFSDGTWTRKFGLKDWPELTNASLFVASQSSEDWPRERVEELTYDTPGVSAYVGSDV